MNKNISAIILAGGKGSRFREDKAFTKIEGKPIIERQLEVLRPIFKDIIIITDTPFLYKDFGLKIFPDIIKDKGPLGGIYTGLVHSCTNYNFFFACDMPFLNRKLITFMMKRAKNADIIIIKYNNKFEPLCAIYSKKCIGPVKQLLCQNGLKISYLFKKVKPCIITSTDLSKVDSIDKSFININTLQEYLKYAH